MPPNQRKSGRETEVSGAYLEAKGNGDNGGTGGVEQRRGKRNIVGGVSHQVAAGDRDGHHRVARAPRVRPCNRDAAD